MMRTPALAENQGLYKLHRPGSGRKRPLGALITQHLKRRTSPETKMPIFCYTFRNWVDNDATQHQYYEIIVQKLNSLNLV
jgi:hypothetical protein